MLLFILMLPTLAQSADIVVFGDSWGTYGAASFKKMASAHGLTVANHAVAGSTAAHWASAANINKLTNWVKQSKAKYVWVTIGGNDAWEQMEVNTSIPKVLASITGNCEKFYKPLFKAVPDIKVVQFGYDVLFWDELECRAVATSMFHWNCGKYGSKNFTVCANGLMSQLQDAIGDMAANYTQLSTVNLLGSLQKAGGIPNADVGKPNPEYFSPLKYTDPTKICLHANNAGYDIIFGHLWDLYFSKHESSY